jgi:hypothetical protein
MDALPERLCPECDCPMYYIYRWQCPACEHEDF